MNRRRLIAALTSAVLLGVADTLRVPRKAVRLRSDDQITLEELQRIYERMTTEGAALPTGVNYTVYFDTPTLNQILTPAPHEQKTMASLPSLGLPPKNRRRGGYYQGPRI